MVWVIITIVVVALAAIVMGVTNWRKDRPGEGIGAFFFTAAFGGVAGMIVCMILNAIGAGIAGIHYETYGSANLAVLQDTSTVSGSFFLGSGYIEETPSFFYYQKNGNEYTLEHYDASRAVVIETDGNPHVEYQKAVGDNELWGIPVSEQEQVRFYVPKGSVVSNYSLDASK